MKRLHVHVNVSDLDQSIRFYSALFDSEPSKVKPDYAKWMLDDPKVNFAISTRAKTPGVDHLGLQVESDKELQQLRENFTKADLDMLNQHETTCCYARSNKTWVQDPSGVAWETYHTMADAQIYGADPGTTATSEESQSACCAPKSNTAKAAAASNCCAP